MLALRRVVGKGRPFGPLTDPGSFWGGRRGGEQNSYYNLVLLPSVHV